MHDAIVVNHLNRFATMLWLRREEMDKTFDECLAGKQDLEFVMLEKELQEKLLTDILTQNIFWPKSVLVVQQNIVNNLGNISKPWSDIVQGFLFKSINLYYYRNSVFIV